MSRAAEVADERCRFVRVEIDRGAGWSMRAEGSTMADLDRLRREARAYAQSYPHRVLVDGSRLIVCVPPGQTLSKLQVHQCHAFAGDQGATIEFLS
jgi:hypothetical protein